MCECGNLDCELLITITVSEYEDVRQNARRFVVVKDHVIPDVERVVAETERFDRGGEAGGHLCRGRRSVGPTGLDARTRGSRVLEFEPEPS